MNYELSDIPPDLNHESSYDSWFRAKVQEALDDPRPGIPHDQVMSEMQTLIESRLSAHQPD